MHTKHTKTLTYQFINKGCFGCQKQGEHAVLGHDNLAMELWVHVSRLPVPHLDKDRRKSTMFTNYSFIFQSASLTRSLRYVHKLQHIIKIRIIKINDSDS